MTGNPAVRGGKKRFSLLKRLRYRWFPVAALASKLRVMHAGSLAQRKNIRRYGKLFIATFEKRDLGGSFIMRVDRSKWESPISIRVSRGASDLPIMEAKLGFTSRAVIIEAIQGVSGREDSVRSFERMSGMPLANLIMQNVEEQAYRCRFTQVKIRRPETLQWYNEPQVPDGYDPELVRERMRKLYYGLARKMGYRKESNFFVKDL